MKHIVTILLISGLLAVSSCVKEKIEGDFFSDRVSLYASIPVSLGSSPSSKGTPESDSGIRDYDYAGELTIGLARIDEGYAAYPDFINCGDPLLATMGSPDGSSSRLRPIDFEYAQFFPGSSEISFAAWYPWSDEPAKDGYKYETGEEATVVTLPIDGQTDIMYSSPVNGSATKKFGVMEFSHALCLYRIHVYAMAYGETGEGDDIADAWGALTSMTIKDMPSSCTITLPRTVHAQDGTDSYRGEVAYDAENKIDIVLSDTENNIFFDPGTPEEGLPVGQANRRHVATFIASPPDDDIIDISLNTENTSAEQDISIARSFSAGYAYDIVLRFSDHGIINADVTVSKWEEGLDIDHSAGATIFYDLSTYGTSNCYHISSANYGYCFDGKVKGNGNTSMLGLGPEDVKLDPAYVDILWSDMPEIKYDGKVTSSVVLASHYLVDGKVMFRVLGNSSDNEDKKLLEEGNVLLAAYDKEPEKNAEGEITNGARIIWTWHLWLCDPVQDQGYSNGFIVQDRNLGAKDDEPADSGENTWGLLYQWGRPTPFRFDGQPYEDCNSSSVSMDEAIASPTTLFGTAEDNDEVWINDPALRPYLVGLWGYVSDWEDPLKTIYDPCPQGYRVYEERMWTGLNGYASDLHDEYVHLDILAYDVYYPFQDTYLASGYIVDHGLDSDSDYGAFLWSGTIDVGQSPNTPYRLIYSHNDNSAISTADDTRRNSAMPVRCVSEHSEMIVKDLSASQTANCYMVHDEGYYKFKANVRGNGVGRLLPHDGTREADITDGMSIDISPVRVDFLWWQGDFTEVSAVDPNDAGDNDPDRFLNVSFLNNGVPDGDGYVTFCVDEFHKGNLIMAAYDPDGRILWTWHIWMTDAPELKASGVYAVMDRFLGATLAPSSFNKSLFSSPEAGMATYGFYYQWGRKDPIPGPPLNGPDDRVDLDSSVWWSYDSSARKWTRHNAITTAPAVSITESVRNPMNFYTSGAAAGDSNSSWFDPSFVDGYKNVALWGYAVADQSIEGESFTKTMYDPCPPGYMVPEYKVWYNNNDSDKYSNQGPGSIKFTNVGSDWNPVYQESGWDSDNGHGMVTTREYFDYNWYPLAGRREPMTGHVKDSGWFGHMWTGTPMGNFNARSLYYDSRQNHFSGQIAESGSGGVMDTGKDASITCGTGPAYGFPVRCMKE